MTALSERRPATGGLARAPTLWVDVGDLIHYLVHHSRPSGIQRVTFEICQALQRRDRPGERVRFVRRVGGPRELMTVRWAELAAAFQVIAEQAGEAEAALDVAAVAEEEPAADPCPAAPDDEPADDEPMDDERTVDEAPAAVAPSPPAALPQARGDVIAAALAAEARALRALARLPLVIGENAAISLRRRHRDAQAARRAAQAARRAAALPPAPAPPAPAPRPPRITISMAQFGQTDSVALADEAAPGDVLLVLGSPWSDREYAHTVRWLRDELRMRFAALIHDLIPFRRPEWCDRHLVSVFTEWHRSVLPLADQVFSNSRATAADVTAWARETGITLHNPVQPVPMGTGAGGPKPGKPAAPPAHLPKPGSYVLFVSTLEARKNHALLFRVWRRLLTDLPRDQVPTLVFAGRVGWLVSDFMQQMENARWLGGKLRLVRDPTDGELNALYEGCLFTLFPSLFEGWGLPISESLALGRPCLASNRTSLPEAGGSLAKYFDPEDLDDAYRAVRAVIDDPVELQAWRARVAREFQQVPWERSAEVIRRTLEGLDLHNESGGNQGTQGKEAVLF